MSSSLLSKIQSNIGSRQIIAVILIAILVYVGVKYFKIHETFGSLATSRTFMDTTTTTLRPSNAWTDNGNANPETVAPANTTEKLINPMDFYSQNFPKEEIKHTNEYLPYKGEQIQNGGYWGSFTSYNAETLDKQNANWGSAQLETVFLK